MGKAINKLFKALYRELSSQETETSSFGTLNILSFLGNLHGALSVFVLSCLAWFSTIILTSCGSSKQISSEKVCVNETVNESRDSVEQKSSSSLSEKTELKSDSVSMTNERKEESSENSETITIIETTIFDTSDTSKNAKPKINKTVKQTKVEKRGASTSSSLKETINKSSNEVVSGNAEKTSESNKSSALISNSRRELESETDKKQSVAESKQMLYVSLVLFGIVLVILVGILAYWVFTKYRPKTKDD